MKLKEDGLTINNQILEGFKKMKANPGVWSTHRPFLSNKTTHFNQTM